MIEEKTPQKILTIGRESDCDVRVNQDDRRTSRHHAQLVLFTDGSVQIVDLNSTNGTYVNGEKIMCPTFLNSTDVVRIGSSPALDWKSLVWPDVSDHIASSPVDLDKKQDDESPIPHSEELPRNGSEQSCDNDNKDYYEGEKANYGESDYDENDGIDHNDEDAPKTDVPITNQDSKPRKRSFWQRLKDLFS